ncbi:MAG: cytidine deaminase [Bacteroidota bacterium]
MEHKTIEIHYKLLQNASELTADEADLLAAALAATNQAYAPFSQFRVGCAVLLEDGSIHIGNNQENKAFPSGTCAERTALFHIGAMGKGDQIRKIAIRARSERADITDPVMPCGACRQVMLEYESMGKVPFVVLTQGKSGRIIRMEGVRQSLLPLSFDIDF